MSLSLSTLIPGSNGIRVTDDIPPRVWTVDLVMAVTGKDKRHAAECLRDVHPSLFDQSKLITRMQQGNGKWPVKLLTFDDAMELIMVLPGKMAKQCRLAVCDLLKRYLAGDVSLIPEIHHNQAVGPLAACNAFLDGALKKRKQPDDAVEYVYCTESAAFPGLLKIGRTSNPMKQRLSAANTFCAPAPHIVVAIAPTFNSTRDERLAHAFFADERREGEFFAVTVQAVQRFFERHIVSQYNSDLADSLRP